MVASATTGIRVDGDERTLVSWRLRASSVGVWSAQVSIDRDAPVAPLSRCVLYDSDGREWHGSVSDARDAGAATLLSVVGGAGRLHEATRERYYSSAVRYADILADLCGEVGEVAGSVEGIAPSWRTRGDTLQAEIERLARAVSGGAWHVAPSDGAVLLAELQDTEQGAKSLVSLESVGGVPGSLWETWYCDGFPVLPGYVLESSPRVWFALLESGQKGKPATATLYARHAPVIPAGATIGATVEAYRDGRVDVLTDRGVRFGGLPLWSAVGVTPSPSPGARVLVLDLADDPRTTIALASPSSDVSRLDLGDGEDIIPPAGDALAAGRVVRYGDMIMFPVGPTATPTPLPVQPSAMAPSTVSKVRA